MESIALILLALAAPPAGTFDAAGVALGASEAAVLKAYPGARCQPMEWKNKAADRRCDDAAAGFGGAEARIAFYLRKDRLQAFDVRFRAADFGRVADYVKGRWGAPDVDRVEVYGRRGDEREVRKLRWKKGADQAALTAQAGRNRAELNVWRGDFDTEVYESR
jgi:hypothetical protein